MPQITKKEFSALDAAPSIQYAKQDATADKAYPVTATAEGNKVRLDVASNIPGFSIPPFDRISASYPSSTQEIYVYTLNSVTVATITVDYSDSAKINITSVVKT